MSISDIRACMFDDAEKLLACRIMSMAQNAALHFLRENKNIRVNTVAPGPIKTQFLPSVFDNHTARTDIFGEAVGTSSDSTKATV